MELKKMEAIINAMDSMTAEEQEQYARLMNMFVPVYNAGHRDGYEKCKSEMKSKEQEAS